MNISIRESPDIFPVLSREAIKSILDCAERANEEAKACFKISFAASIIGCVYFAICRIRDCVQRSRARGDEHSEDGGDVEMWRCGMCQLSEGRGRYWVCHRCNQARLIVLLVELW